MELMIHVLCMKAVAKAMEDGRMGLEIITRDEGLYGQAAPLWFTCG